MRITLGLNLLGAIWLAASAGLTTAAQLTTTQPLSAPAATQPASEQLTLNFPENVELRVLVEYVSQRLGINIFYDQQTITQQVTIRAPASRGARSWPVLERRPTDRRSRLLPGSILNDQPFRSQNGRF